MKKTCALLLALLLCLAVAARAESGVEVELIKMDGVSVVEMVLIDDGLKLPAGLTRIADEAFANIAAGSVEVSENVTAIGARAFADCKNLREIFIPASVQTIDDTALEGCGKVTVYGTRNTEAERFAQAMGFNFVDPVNDPPTPSNLIVLEAPTVVLPFVSAF